MGSPQKGFQCSDFSFSVQSKAAKTSEKPQLSVVDDLVGAMTASLQQGDVSVQGLEVPGEWPIIITTILVIITNYYY